LVDQVALRKCFNGWKAYVPKICRLTAFWDWRVQMFPEMSGTAAGGFEKEGFLISLICQALSQR
jgi:hypothetical protein